MPSISKSTLHPKSHRVFQNSKIKFDFLRIRKQENCLFFCFWFRKTSSKVSDNYGMCEQLKKFSSKIISISKNDVENDEQILISTNIEGEKSLEFTTVVQINLISQGLHRCVRHAFFPHLEILRYLV